MKNILIKLHGRTYNLKSQKENGFITQKNLLHLQNFSLGCIKFINIQNKIINGAFSACYITSGGKWRQALGAELRNEWQNNKYDSCNLRPEYFYVKAIFKGASSNCFISRHLDPKKELYFPDDPTNTSSGGLKKYINDNSLILPKIMLGFQSVYYSNKRDKAITMGLSINPEAYGANDMLFETEKSCRRNPYRPCRTGRQIVGKKNRWKKSL